MAGVVHHIEHPLIQHKLTLMRRRETSTGAFRRLLQEISMLLAYEVTRDLPLTYEDIETPITTMSAPKVEGKKVVVISVLRAGDGIRDGMLAVLPSARVGHIGMARDPKTLEAHEYYFKVPRNMGEREVILCDPMLATGNSAIAATSRVLQTGPKKLKFVCLVAAPEGIEAFHAAHPDVPIYTPAIDEKLNEKGYIVPGLGDAGDRLFGTK
ncbi:MAG: uracil phosphoribosyltransferase [Myxococcota bacterium]